MSTKKTFELSEKQAYIQLNQLLKIEQIAQTGGHAKILIEEGQIQVNKEVEHRIRRKLHKGDIIVFEEIEIEIV